MPLTVYVDVDDTLVRSVGTKRIPMPSVVRHVRELKEQGATLYCWSSGGAEYARTSAEELGIADCFSAFLSKPHILLDDQEINTWSRLLVVHPATCTDYTVEDYEQALKSCPSSRG